MLILNLLISDKYFWDELYSRLNFKDSFSLKHKITKWETGHDSLMKKSRQMTMNNLEKFKSKFKKKSKLHNPEHEKQRSFARTQQKY